MTSIASAVLLTALAGTAWAQEVDGDPCGGEPADDSGGGEGEGEAVSDAPPPPGSADAGTAGGKPPMILAQGKLAVHGSIGVSLAADAVAKPITIAPDVYYGVMPKLEVGVVHSNMGLSGFWFQGLPSGVCVTGESSNCPKLYNGPIGILAHYLLVEGNVDLAADGGLVIAQLSDPTMLGLKVGVRGRWMSGKLGVFFAPNIYIGLTERDFNKEDITVPVTVGFMVSPKLHAGLQTGIAGPLDGFGDSFIVPVGVGAMFMVNEKLSVGGSFNFWNLAGKDSSADFRDLTISAMWQN